MAGTAHWESFEIADPSSVLIIDDVVGLVYRARARRSTDEDEYRAHILNVYRRQERHWPLILHQQTPLQP